MTFVDYSNNGNYRLITPNVYHVHALNISQEKNQKPFTTEKSLFDYDWRIKKLKKEGNKIDISVIIEVPYENLWLIAKDDKMETILQFSLEIIDDKGRRIKKHENDYFVSTTEQEFKRIKGKNYVIEVPLSLTKGIYIIYSELVNTAGEERRSKELKLHL